jgi:colanic acid biosynthesis glycosyl transferase WcaI
VRILLLNLYYPPDTSATAKMARTVVEALAVAHEVTILSGRPSYDPVERRPWRIWQSETNGRTRVVRVGSTDYPRFRMTRRIVNYLTYAILAVPCALFLRCDVIIGMTDPPFEGILGALVALLKGKPFVYNIRDLYPDMALAGSIVEPGVLSRFWETLHRWALRRAAKVIVLGEDMRARIADKGISEERLEVVRDGADLGFAPEVNRQVVRTIRGDSRFVLLHAGNVGFYGAWETLVAGARELGGDGVGLVFVGDGAQLVRVEGLAAGAPNIRFLPFFPASQIPSVLAAADMHVITVKPSLTGVVVPSKLYGILAAGKPLLVMAARETEAAQIAERRNCGCVVSAIDAREMVQAVRELLAEPSRLEQLSGNSRAAAPSYDRVNELKRFVAIVREVLSA